MISSPPKPSSLLLSTTTTKCVVRLDLSHYLVVLLLLLVTTNHCSYYNVNGNPIVVSSSIMMTTSNTNLRASSLSTNHHHYSRSLQQGKSCNDKFAVYNGTSGLTNKIEPVVTTTGAIQGRILLDTYPKGRINILYDPTTCYTNVKCIKLNWGKFQETIQTVPPYALYGDENGIPLTVQPIGNSWQLLTATNYPTVDCSGNTTIGIDTLNVQIVPQTAKTYRFRPIHAIYKGTTASNATTEEINAVVTATCDFIKTHINSALLLRASMTTTQFICKLRTQSGGNSNLPSTPPLLISYQIVFNLIQLPKLGQYVNKDLMSNVESVEYIRGLFYDINKIGIYGDARMSQWVKSKLPNTNPFKIYTTISIV